MELSKEQRLILYNQYEILKSIQPENLEHYEVRQQILEHGYKHEYYKMFDFLGDEMPDDIASFVWDVLEMYRDLFDSYDELESPQKETVDQQSVQFKGFDGNEEPAYYGYVCFIVNDMKRYQEIKTYSDELNSHWPVMDRYEAMLDEWKQIREIKNRRLKLNAEEILKITGI